MKTEQDVRNTAVFVDSGSSTRKEDRENQELGIEVLPLDIKFYERGQWVPYADSEISANEFYDRLRKAPKLPQTSGAITSRAVAGYERAIANGSGSIVSVHITSEHSVSWESALLASQMVKENNKGVFIEVIDSRTVSLGTWYLAEMAARMANEGAEIEEIRNEVLTHIPKIEVFTLVASLDNLVKGGRVSAMMGYVGNLLKLNPIVGLVDGKITGLAKTRTMEKGKRELIARVENRDKELVRLAVLHTNSPEEAEEMREQLSSIYSGEIMVRDAGPVLGVHLGERGLGIALMSK